MFNVENVSVYCHSVLTIFTLKRGLFMQLFYYMTITLKFLLHSFQFKRFVVFRIRSFVSFAIPIKEIEIKENNNSIMSISMWHFCLFASVIERIHGICQWFDQRYCCCYFNLSVTVLLEEQQQITNTSTTTIKRISTKER